MRVGDAPGRPLVALALQFGKKLVQPLSVIHRRAGRLGIGRRGAGERHAKGERKDDPHAGESRPPLWQVKLNFA